MALFFFFCCGDSPPRITFKRSCATQLFHFWRLCFLFERKSTTGGGSPPRSGRLILTQGTHDSCCFLSLKAGTPGLSALVAPCSLSLFFFCILASPATPPRCQCSHLTIHTHTHTHLTRRYYGGTRSYQCFASCGGGLVHNWSLRRFCLLSVSQR